MKLIFEHRQPIGPATAAWCTLVAFVTLATLAGENDARRAGAQEQPEPKPARNFDDATATAWKTAGAKVGWIGKDRDGYVQFKARPDALTTPMPALTFVQGQVESLGGLPDPAVPFGLYLNYTQVTDAGLKELAGLKSLQSLCLRNTEVTDMGLKELTSFPSLRTLDLFDTQVTDSGMKELAGLKSLQTLWLGNTRVTNAGLKELARLPKLQFLWLRARAKINSTTWGFLLQVILRYSPYARCSCNRTDSSQIPILGSCIG